MTYIIHFVNYVCHITSHQYTTLHSYITINPTTLLSHTTTDHSYINANSLSQLITVCDINTLVFINDRHRRQWVQDDDDGDDDDALCFIHCP